MNAPVKKTRPRLDDDSVDPTINEPAKIPPPPGAMLCADGCFRDRRWVKRHGAAIDREELKRLPS